MNKTQQEKNKNNVNAALNALFRWLPGGQEECEEYRKRQPKVCWRNFIYASKSQMNLSIFNSYINLTEQLHIS